MNGLGGFKNNLGGNFLNRYKSDVYNKKKQVYNQTKNLNATDNIDLKKNNYTLLSKKSKEIDNEINKSKIISKKFIEEFESKKLKDREMYESEIRKILEKKGLAYKFSLPFKNRTSLAYNEKIAKLIINVFDIKNDKLIKQIPPKEIQKIYLIYNELKEKNNKGAFINEIV